MTTVIIGVDPGNDGALACLVNGDLFDVQDMPTRSNGVRRNGKQKRQVDPHAVRDLLRGWFVSCDRDMSPVVVIEHVQSSPGAGATSMFTFGQGFGLIEGVAVGLGLTPDLVKPEVWKPHLGIGSDKDRSRELAANRWPEWADEFRRKKDADRAEAALIAHWWECAHAVPVLEGTDEFNRGFAREVRP